jgi:rhodanese-related sulfurtransferase
LGGQYASWAGTLLDRERPIVLLADPGREEEAALRLGRIGFDVVAGYLRNGMQALDGRADLVALSERIVPSIAAEALSSSEPPVVIDVRTPQEWRTGHIEGSRNLPLSRLAGQMGDVPAGRPLLVHCAGGYRSSIAASLLRRQGFRNLTELAGGLGAWEAAGLPIQRP